MVKLHVLSDLHLEIAHFRPPKTEADIVVLAGDIGHATKGIEWARSTFDERPVIYVPGNHEFFGVQRSDALLAMREVAQKCGVHLLDQNSVIVHSADGDQHVRFLGCTLWTNFCLFGDDRKQQAMAAAQEGLRDFMLIRDGVLLFHPAQSAELHKNALGWLVEELARPFDGKTVVVTHHLPSARSVVERYQEDLLSACFASRLDSLFGRMDLWIHGHTHDNVDYVMSGTRVICNPRGWVTRSGAENPAFKPDLVLEI